MAKKKTMTAQLLLAIRGKDAGPLQGPATARSNQLLALHVCKLVAGLRSIWIRSRV